jgi:hypothetical protein
LYNGHNQYFSVSELKSVFAGFEHEEIEAVKNDLEWLYGSDWRNRGIVDVEVLEQANSELSRILSVVATFPSWTVQLATFSSVRLVLAIIVMPSIMDNIAVPHRSSNLHQVN